MKAMTCWTCCAWRMLLPLCLAKLATSSDYESAEVLCWGTGDGNAVPEFFSHTVAKLACNAEATCAISDSGELTCFGHRWYAKDDQKPSVPMKSVAGGYNNWCGVTEDDAVMCWGWCGDNCNVPNGLPPIAQVAAGRESTCARDFGGSVTCWGKNSYGELDVPTDLAPSTALAAGWLHHCSLSADGKVACWGAGSPSSPGGWAMNQGYPPADIQGEVTSLYGGSYYTCAILNGGSWQCWGDSFDSTSAAGTSYLGMAMDGDMRCAWDHAQQSTCWGDNSYQGADVPADLGITLDMCVGRFHTCALRIPTTTTNTTTISSSSTTTSTESTSTTSSSSSSYSSSTSTSTSVTTTTTTTSTSSSSGTSTSSSSSSLTSSSSSSSSTTSSTSSTSTSSTTSSISSSSSSSSTSSSTSTITTTSSSTETSTSTSSTSSTSSSSSTSSTSSTTSDSSTTSTTSTSSSSGTTSTSTSSSSRTSSSSTSTTSSSTSSTSMSSSSTSTVTTSSTSTGTITSTTTSSSSSSSSMSSSSTSSTSSTFSSSSSSSTSSSRSSTGTTSSTTSATSTTTTSFSSSSSSSSSTQSSTTTTSATVTTVTTSSTATTSTSSVTSTSSSATTTTTSTASSTSTLTSTSSTSQSSSSTSSTSSSSSVSSTASSTSSSTSTLTASTSTSSSSTSSSSRTSSSTSSVSSSSTSSATGTTTSSSSSSSTVTDSTSSSSSSSTTETATETSTTSTATTTTSGTSTGTVTTTTETGTSSTTWTSTTTISGTTSETTTTSRTSSSSSSSTSTSTATTATSTRTTSRSSTSRSSSSSSSSSSTTSVSGTTTSTTSSSSSATNTSSTSSSTSTGTQTSRTSTTTASTSTATIRTTPPPTVADETSKVVEEAATEVLEKLKESNETVQSTTTEEGLVISVVRLFKVVLEPPKPSTGNNSQASQRPNKSEVVDTVTVTVESGVEEKVKVVIPTVALTNLTPSSEEGDEPTLIVSPIDVSFFFAQVTAGGGEEDKDGGAGAEKPARPVVIPTTPKPGQTLAPGDIGTPESNIPLAATQLDLRYLLSGETIPVKDLDKPVYFTMPSVKYTAHMTCLFYDEELKVWSSEGTGPSTDNVEGETMTCWTKHFSLFGAFLQGFTDVFLCAQFHLFTPEAIARLWEGNWYRKLGACVLWATLGLIAFAFLVSAIIDGRRARSMTWLNEFFLIPMHDGPQPNEEAIAPMSSLGSDEDLLDQRGGQCWVGALSGPVVAIFRPACTYVGNKLPALQGGQAMWDAIDDVAENWFESFGDLRSFVEGLVQGLEMRSSGGAGATSRVYGACHSVMCNMTLLTSRRLAGAEMGLSDEVVSFVLDDKDLRMCLTEHHRTTDLRALSVGWQRLETREECWTSLHDEVCSQLHEAIAKQESWLYFPMAITRLFAAHTPFGSMWTHNIFMTCKMRTLFFSVEITGAFLLVAFFFQASGGVSSVENEEDEECGSGDSEDPAYALGRLIAVGIGSVCVSGMPVKLLNSLHTRRFHRLEYAGCPQWRRQLRAWEMQDKLIWILGTCYLSFGAFFVMLFLANIGEEDHLEFSQSGVIAVLQNCLVLPAALAVSVPFLTCLLITLISKFGKINRTQLLVDVRHKLNRSTNAMLPVMQV